MSVSLGRLAPSFRSCAPCVGFVMRTLLCDSNPDMALLELVWREKERTRNDEYLVSGLFLCSRFARFSPADSSTPSNVMPQSKHSTKTNCDQKITTLKNRPLHDAHQLLHAQQIDLRIVIISISLHGRSQRKGSPLDSQNRVLSNRPPSPPT